MNILKEEDLENGWPIEFFQKAYPVPHTGENIRKFFAVTKGSESGDPDKTSVIFVRLFIENGEKAKKDQKYIAGLRFYGFGDMATLDIISLNKEKHADIIKEHVKRMVLVEESNTIPIFATGARLKISENGLDFFGISGDFGNNLLGFDVNEVAKQIAFLVDLSKKENQKGKSFFDDLLFFLLNNKRRGDFYEMLVKNYISDKLTAQNFSSLLNMKVFDRAFKEKSEDLLGIMVEEITGGFLKKCIALGVVKRNEIIK